jgi:hypothetical protein
METKICKRCGVERDINRYAKRNKGGINHVCNTCYNAAAHQRKMGGVPATPKEPVYVRPKDAVQRPYALPIWERETYVPPKWGR